MPAYITRDEKDAIRKKLKIASATFPNIVWPGEDPNLPNNISFIRLRRTNIYSNEMLGANNSHRRFRNTFFQTVEIFVPLTFPTDVESEAERLIAQLMEIFKPRSHIPVIGTGYDSKGLKIIENETEDENEFGSSESEQEDFESTHFRSSFRMKIEHEYFLPR